MTLYREIKKPPTGLPPYGTVIDGYGDWLVPAEPCEHGNYAPHDAPALHSIRENTGAELYVLVRCAGEPT